MIELRESTIPGEEGLLNEVIAKNASVHLEVLSHDAVMLIIEDDARHIHLRLTHRGRVPIQVWVLEESEVR